MGIDIYANWRDKSKDEKEAQITGFDPYSGKFGYLREAYHGGPYATRYLVPEAFDHEAPDFDEEKGAAIEAKVLRERLPATVLLSLYRNQQVYGEKSDKLFKFRLGEDTAKQLVQTLAHIFTVEVTDKSHIGVAERFTPEHLAMAQQLIEKHALPEFAQSFVDFVELCEQKQTVTGEPCRIYSSY